MKTIIFQANLVSWVNSPHFGVSLFTLLFLSQSVGTGGKKGNKGRERGGRKGMKEGRKGRRGGEERKEGKKKGREGEKKGRERKERKAPL